MIVADPVLNNVINERVTVNSNDLLSRITIGQDSTPYRSTGRQLIRIKFRTTGFGCEPPNFAKNCVKRFKELTLRVIKRTLEYPLTDEEYA